MTHLLVLLLPLAADPVPEPSDVKPGGIALLVVSLLVAASIFLWFSMRKQLGRIQVPRDRGAPTDTPPESPTQHRATNPGEGPNDRPPSSPTG
jgi:hypothetical protein